MTNNDELALKLKAAAEIATPGEWERGDGKHGGELLVYCDDALGSAVCEATSTYNSIPKLQRISNLTFIATANPANILALLAERDEDKKQIADMQEQLARYSMSPGEADQRRCESRAVRDALGFGKDADNVAPVDLREKIDAFRLRIAELEARTVSVKLPENIPCPGAPQTIWLQTNGDDSNESSWPENSNDVSWCWEKMFHNDTLYVRADLAAGIKLEVGE